MSEYQTKNGNVTGAITRGPGAMHHPALTVAPLENTLGENQSAPPSIGVTSTVPRTETLHLAALLTAAPLTGIRDEPDFRFYDMPWSREIVFFFLWITINVGAVVLLDTGSGTNIVYYILPTSPDYEYKYAPVSTVYLLLLFTISLITIEDIKRGTGNGETGCLIAFLAKAIVFTLCAFIFLVIDLSVSEILYGPRLEAFWLVPILSSVLLYLVTSKEINFLFSRRFSAKQNFQGLFYLAVWCGCVGLFWWISLDAQLVPSSGWLGWPYMVVPPALYVAVCIVYWGVPKIISLVRVVVQ